MKKHTLRFRTVDRVDFDTLVDGRKTVETRAATDKYKKIQVGDVLVIKCGDEVIEKAVKKVEIFTGIDELVSAVGLHNIMPLVKDLAEAKKVWYSYPGYKEKIEKHGLVAWHI
jgi:ASC-1-like (ASCH) protein